MNCLRKSICNTNMSRLLQAINIPNVIRPFATEIKKTLDIPKEENNEPVKFFGSKAANWKAKSSRSGGADESLWYQPYVISGSLAVFLIYFCILREENDIDMELETSLFDRVEGLEETQLIMSYRYNKENNLDNSAIESRLKEIGVTIES